MDEYALIKDYNKQMAKKRYHEGGGKEKAQEYYEANKETIKEKAKNRYQELTKEQKELRRKYSRDQYKQLAETYNKLKMIFSFPA